MAMVVVKAGLLRASRDRQGNGKSECRSRFPSGMTNN